MPARQARRSAGVLPRCCARRVEKNRVQPVAGRSCLRARLYICGPGQGPSPASLWRADPTLRPPCTLSGRRASRRPSGPWRRYCAHQSDKWLRRILSSRHTAAPLSPASTRCIAESFTSRVKTRLLPVDIFLLLGELSIVFVSQFRGALHWASLSQRKQQVTAPGNGTIADHCCLQWERPVARVQFER